MGNDHPLAAWSTRNVVPSRQFSSWREAVSDTHLAWDLPARRQAEFRALIAPQRLGPASLVECICDPCSGRRGRAEIAPSSAAFFGVLYLLRGTEVVRQGGREARLQAGDMTLWDSTRPIDFAIGDPLHKITLLLPQALLDPILPRAQDRVARVTSARGGCAALLAGHLRTLARERTQLHAASLPLLLRATLDLVASALSADDAQEASDRHSLLARIQAFIVAHLHDPELDPLRIAAAHRISVRQLHRIFQASATTVERWIWEQRLQRCQRELLAPGSRSISRIAYEWGFSDAAHFSRAFRERFGLSPREARRQAAQQTQKSAS